MRIIFSEDFINDLKNYSKVIKISNYLIKNSLSGNGINISNLGYQDSEELKPLMSIWDDISKKLSISLTPDEVDKETLVGEIERDSYCYVICTYICDSIEKTAFILIGEDTTLDDTGNLILGKLNFSITNNIINIKFTDDIISKIETNLTENINFLESSLCIGNNIYLLGIDDTFETITIDSFKKYLLSNKCKSINTSRSNYLDPDTGEKVLEDQVFRVYKTDAFYPKLSGDLVVIRSEKELETRTTTTTTTTPKPTPTISTTTTTTTTKDPNSITTLLPELIGSTTTTTTSTVLPSFPNPPKPELITATTTTTSTTDQPLIKQRSMAVKATAVFDTTTTSTTTGGPITTTTTSTLLPDVDGGIVNGGNSESSIVYVYNSFGLNHLGGKIQVTGVIGYTDYVIRNNKIISEIGGYQDLTTISGISYKNLPLTSSGSFYDPIWKDWDNIDNWTENNIITYPESKNPVKTFGNRLQISVKFLDLLGNMKECTKEFKLKQSDDFSKPWEIFENLPSGAELNWEYEQTKKGIYKDQIPVYILPPGNLGEEMSLSLKIVTSEPLVHIAICDYFGLDTKLNYTYSNDVLGKFSIDYEFAEGYDNSRGLKLGSDSVTLVPKENNESASVVFNRFFDLQHDKYSVNVEENIYTHTLRVSSKKNSSGLNFFESSIGIWSDRVPLNYWSPFSNMGEGEQDQLLVKCLLNLKFNENVNVLEGTNTYSSSFYVVQKPEYIINPEDISIRSIDKDSQGNISLGDRIYNIQLRKNEENTYSSNIRIDVPRSSHSVSDVNNAWTILNKNLGLSINPNYGSLTLDSNALSNRIEFSQVITVEHPTKSDQDFKNITVNYLDHLILGTKTIDQVIKGYDLDDWKLTILNPSIDIPVSFKSDTTISFKSIQKNWENKYEEVEYNNVYLQNLYDDAYLGISRSGRFYIIIKTNTDIELKFERSSILPEPITNIKFPQDEIIKVDSQNESLQEYIIYFDVEISSLISEVITGSGEVIGAIYINNVKLPIRNYMLQLKYEEAEKVEPRIGDLILEDIFLSGYDDDTINVNKLTLNGEEILSFGTFDNIIDNSIELSVKTAYKPIILGTTENNKLLLPPIQFDENGNYYSILDSDPEMIFSEELQEIPEYKTSLSLATSVKSDFIFEQKYPNGLLKLGTVIALDTSAELSYTVMKRGISPNLYSNYYEKLPSLVEINLLDTEVMVGNLSSEGPAYYIYNYVENNFEFDILSAYPLDDDFLSKDITKTQDLEDSIVRWEGTLNRSNFTSLGIGKNTLKISDIDKETLLDDEKTWVTLGTITLNHHIPKDVVSEQLSSYSQEDVNKIIGEHKVSLRINRVNLDYSHLQGDDYEFVDFLGETKSLTLNKPHTLLVNVDSYKSVEGITTTIPQTRYDFSQGTPIMIDGTFKNSTIKFDVVYPECSPIVDFIRNSNEPLSIDEIKNNSSILYQNYSANLTLSLHRLINIPEINLINHDIRKSITKVAHQKIQNGIIFRDKSVNEDYSLFIRGNKIIETINKNHNTDLILSTVERIIDFDVTKVNFSAIFIDDLATLLDFSEENLNPENSENLNIELLDGLSTDTLTIDNSSLDNIELSFLGQNNSPNEIIRNLRISCGDVEFNYIIKQLPYVVGLEINGQSVDNEITLGFHSSGNYLSREPENFGFITLKTNTNDIFDEKGLLKIDDSNVSQFISSITPESGTGNIICKVSLSLKPNYSNKPIESFFTISDGYGRSWKINYIQGYLTSRLIDNQGNIFDYENSFSNNHYAIGNSDLPIIYPARDVKFDPYYIVHILQREIIYNGDLVELGEEVIINSNYNKVSNLQRSVRNKYAIVTYEANDWVEKEGSLSKVFKPGTYDTDLFYSNDLEDYPRLIHRYDISENYSNNKLEFEITTKFKIDRYKKYPYREDNITDNIISDPLDFNTTPFIYQFYIKKDTVERELPVEFILPENSETNSITFNGTFETKSIYIKVLNNNFSIDDIEFNCSETWLDISLNKVDKLLVLNARCNNTSEVREGFINIFAKEDSGWSGTKTIDVVQIIPNIAISEDKFAMHWDNQFLVMPLSINKNIVKEITEISYTESDDSNYREYKFFPGDDFAEKSTIYLNYNAGINIDLVESSEVIYVGCYSHDVDECGNSEVFEFFLGNECYNEIEIQINGLVITLDGATQYKIVVPKYNQVTMLIPSTDFTRATVWTDIIEKSIEFTPYYTISSVMTDNNSAYTDNNLVFIVEPNMSSIKDKVSRLVVTFDYKKFDETEESWTEIREVRQEKLPDELIPTTTTTTTTSTTTTTTTGTPEPPKDDDQCDEEFCDDFTCDKDTCDDGGSEKQTTTTSEPDTGGEDNPEGEI